MNLPDEGMFLWHDHFFQALFFLKRKVAFDSWFFCQELVDHLEELGKDWISMSKGNRKVVVKGRSKSAAEPGQSLNCTRYAQELDPDQVRETKVRNRRYRIKSIQARFPCLKRGHQTVRLVVSFEQRNQDDQSQANREQDRQDQKRQDQDKEEKRERQDRQGQERKERQDKSNGYKDPVFIVSNRKDIRPERLIQAYQLRWNIETFFKDAKSHLGLGQYQMRKLNGIKSHWCLVFTSAVLLELVRHQVCTRESLAISQLTFGDLKQRAFGQTLRAIISQVLSYSQQGLETEQVYAKLGV